MCLSEFSILHLALALVLYHNDCEYYYLTRNDCVFDLEEMDADKVELLKPPNVKKEEIKNCLKDRLNRIRQKVSTADKFINDGASSANFMDDLSIDSLAGMFEATHALHPSVRSSTPVGNVLSFDKLNPLILLEDSDDRLDIVDVDDIKIKDNASSVFAIVDSSKLKADRDGYYIEYRSLGQDEKEEHFELCKCEKFYHQPVISKLTAFAVGENMVVTAGHLLKTENEADDIKLKRLKKFKLIKFYIDQKEQYKDDFSELLRFKKSEIYSIKNFHYHKWSENSNNPNNDSDNYIEDYIFLELDRKITGSKIITEFDNSVDSENSEYYIIGYPKGLPLKIAQNGCRIKIGRL